MKLRMIDRVLAVAAGILLVGVGIPPLFDTVFGTGMLEGLGGIARTGGAGSALLMILLALLMLVVGALCVLLGIRRVHGKGFVVQSNELGEVSISMRALEGLVDRCAEKHEELHVTSTLLENTRDGLVIKLCANMASGVNIPQAVKTLQKQIKTYVTTCSGVDVYEVKVQVDATGAKGKPSAFAVPDVLENPAPLPREETAEDEAPAEPREEKCLHQRLFSEEEQPAIVPVPPVEEPAEASDEAEAEPEPNEEPADEETGEYEVDAESIADLEALDGADAEPEDNQEETNGSEASHEMDPAE